MWIFLGILSFIIFLLLMPIYIIIKNDGNNNNIFSVKFLFFNFAFNGDHPRKTKKSEKTDQETENESEETVTEQQPIKIKDIVINNVEEKDGRPVAVFEEV